MTSEAQGGGEAHGGPADEPRRLRRSRSSRMVAGVCGGLAEYFGLHPAIYRVIFVALTIAGGTGLLLYAAADVMVTRAGGMTVAELAAVGKAAIVVPLPGSPGDHQTANGRMLERAGGAVLVPDDELTVDRLERELGPLVADDARRDAMAAAAASVGHRDAAAAIAELVERHARR